eukprot:Phypoly_transcript_11461.p1 GENE.Phypoly_transcript_11461~~Phypoly_transcript_11461.p1  ORF type:complete len:180 (+),score=61.71 Phypoly_transcript_11461:665-1204(+)
MRKNGVPIPEDLAEAAKLAKSKAHPSENPENSENSGKKPTLPKKTKKTLSNKEKRQKEKAKRALENDGELDDPTTVRKKKKAKVESTPGKKHKAFLDDASQALKVADQVNDQQEMAYQAKLDKEYSKLSVDTRKKIERKEKKVQLRAMRKEEVEKAINKFPKNDKKKKSATKVSFVEEK